MDCYLFIPNSHFHTSAFTGGNVSLPSSSARGAGSWLPCHPPGGPQSEHVLKAWLARLFRFPGHSNWFKMGKWAKGGNQKQSWD